MLLRGGWCLRPSRAPAGPVWAERLQGARAWGPPGPECPWALLPPQLEALNQCINIEQSQSDRSKRPFNPVT